MEFHQTVEDARIALDRELSIQLVSVGSTATELCRAQYPKMLVRLYRASPSIPPRISYDWVDSDDVITLRALIRRSDFTYIVASTEDAAALRSVSAAAQAERDSFTVTAWLGSPDAMPHMETPHIAVSRQALTPFWDICSSHYVISFIGIDWIDISDAFRFFADFSCTEFKGSVSSEQLIFDRDPYEQLRELRHHETPLSVFLVTYLRESIDLSLAADASSQILSLLPDNASVIQNMWTVAPSVLHEDVLIRIYYGERRGIR